MKCSLSVIPIFYSNELIYCHWKTLGTIILITTIAGYLPEYHVLQMDQGASVSKGMSICLQTRAASQ